MFTKKFLRLCLVAKNHAHVFHVSDYLIDYEMVSLKKLVGVGMVNLAFHGVDAVKLRTNGLYFDGINESCPDTGSITAYDNDFDGVALQELSSQNHGLRKSEAIDNVKFIYFEKIIKYIFWFFKY